MDNPIPIAGGGFYLARKLFDSAVWFKPPLYIKIWVWILGQASYSDREMRGIPCSRGEFITTYDEIIRSNSHWHNKAHLSPSLKQIRIILEWLKSQGMISIQPIQDFQRPTGADPKARTRAYLGIKIIVKNYSNYQNQESYRGRDKGRPSVQLGHIINKKDKKERNTLSGQKTPDPRVKEFFDYWGETFLQETGQPYVFSFAKEGKLVKDLLKVHSLELIQETSRAFFKDERCKHRGLTIGILFQEINRLLSMRAMDPLEQARRELGRESFQG